MGLLLQPEGPGEVSREKEEQAVVGTQVALKAYIPEEAGVEETVLSDQMAAGITVVQAVLVRSAYSILPIMAVGVVEAEAHHRQT